jgi:LacI family transcriptional regulator
MAVTLKDIAHRVGKSVTTVSRALADYKDVSPATKEIVQQVAKELGYSPSTVARRLQKRQSDTLGLILPTFGPRFADPFFSELIAGIGNKASVLGYDLLVSTCAPGEAELHTYQEMVGGRRVDGFLIVRTRREDPRITFLSAAQFPFVAFGRTASINNFPYVDEDGQLGMRLIGEHLTQLGHHRVAYIGPPEGFMFAHYRKTGLFEGLGNGGVEIPASYILEGDLTQRGGFQQTIELLNLPTPPTAIAAGNDLMAFGAVSAAQDRGYQVGRDITITGFDDIPMAEHSHPGLTTIHQPIYQIGGMICEMLTRIIHREELPDTQILLTPKLMIRNSSGPAALRKGGAS